MGDNHIAKCRAKKMKNYFTGNGTDLPSEKEIIAAFTENGVGMAVGYVLYNKLRLTTQVSKNIQIYTSALDEQKKQIGNVFLQKCDMVFSPEVVRMVAMLEVLQNYDRIEDWNESQFKKLCAEFAGQYDEKVFEYVLSNISYSEQTIARLKAIIGS